MTATVNSNSTPSIGARATVKCSFKKGLQTVLLEKQNDKKSPKAHSGVLRPLGLSGAYTHKGYEKANQCMYHGCDCGYKYGQAPSETGSAFYGNNNGINRNNANNHNDNGSFCAALRVYELCTDFNQPPSILSILARRFLFY